MTIDTTRPFRLDVEPNDIEVVLHADTPANALRVIGHGIRLDGTRIISATVGEFQVMYRTVVTAEQYAEIAQASNDYDADPVAGWAALRTRLAAENLGILDTTLVTDPHPFSLLRYESLAFQDAPLAASVAHHEHTDRGHVVRMPLGFGTGFTRLYAGAEDPTEDVERFNQDPDTGFAKLWAAAVAERAVLRRRAIEALAAEQVRDLRIVERTLRTGRATGGDA